MTSSTGNNGSGISSLLLLLLCFLCFLIFFLFLSSDSLSEELFKALILFPRGMESSEDPEFESTLLSVGFWECSVEAELTLGPASGSDSPD